MSIHIDRLDASFILLTVLALAAVFTLYQLVMQAKVQDRRPLTRLACWLRRLVRRGSWYYLFPLVVLAYPYFYNFLIYLEIRGLHSQDLVDAAAAAAAKMVDPVQFYSKSLVAVSNFCLINALGWAALLVVPVLVDWATGYYSQPKNYEAVGLQYPVTGFKRTFLSLNGTWRIGFYILVWAIELGIAAHSVDSAFRMQ